MKIASRIGFFSTFCILASTLSSCQILKGYLFEKFVDCMLFNNCPKEINIESIPSTPKPSKKYIENYPDGSFYEGEFQNGLRHGEGLYVWKNGDQYLGEWKEGKKQGKGVWQGYDGQMVKGIWDNDKLVKKIP